MFKSKHIQFILLLVVGLVLIYFTLNRISYADLIATLNQANYWVCIPVFTISIIGYIARIYRWKMMLISLGSENKLKNLFAALCMGYGVNFVVPRLGEFTRCFVIKQTDNTRFDKALMSIVVERLLDTMVLFILIIMTTYLYANRISQFIQAYIIQPIVNNFGSLSIYLILVVIIAIVILLVMLFFSASVKNIFRQYFDMLERLYESAKKIQFWIATGVIWLCYFMMTYLWFYAFDATQNLTVSDAFFLMVIGSIGRSVPIQGGGLGAYHFLIAHAGLLLGLTLVEGNALAILIHGAQSILTLFLAAISYIWFLYHIK